MFSAVPSNPVRSARSSRIVAIVFGPLALTTDAAALCLERLATGREQHTLGGIGGQHA
jgi:hypothetical protein